MKTYQVLEIFRSFVKEKHYEFHILLYNEKVVLKKLSNAVYSTIAKGHLFKRDYIDVFDDSNEEIDFIKVEPSTFMYTNTLDVREYIYGKKKLLPFLNDTLPYFNTILPVQDIEKNNEEYISNGLKFVDTFPKNNTPFIGVIAYKTRINVTITNNKHNYYFFMIVEVDKMLIKVVIWKENVKYSSLKVGDTIGISKYRLNKGFSGINCIDYNRFSEASFFDLTEITGTEIVKLNYDLPIKHQYDIFENLKGFINYRSVLNRRNHFLIDEYYLLLVDNVPVVLFYNSDEVFYEIEAGNRIEICNLRKVVRGDYEFFISTIYTQILYSRISELDSECSSFLYENEVIKRPIDSSSSLDSTPHKKKKITNNLDVKKADLWTSEEEDNAENISITQFIRTVDPKKKDDLEIKGDELKYLFKENKIGKFFNNKFKMKEYENAEPVEAKVEIKEYPMTSNLSLLDEIKNTDKLFVPEKKARKKGNKYIDSAYGFIPDNFKNIEDVFKEETLELRGHLYDIINLYTPQNVQIKNLKEKFDELVLNEEAKFIIKGTLTDYDFSNQNGEQTYAGGDEITLSYIDAGKIMEQLPSYLKIVDEEELEILVFKNYFFNKKQKGFEILPGCKSYKDFKDCIGRSYYFIINLFRASEDYVIISLSSVLNVD